MVIAGTVMNDPDEALTATIASLLSLTSGGSSEGQSSNCRLSGLLCFVSTVVARRA